MQIHNTNIDHPSLFSQDPPSSHTNEEAQDSTFSSSSTINRYMNQHQQQIIGSYHNSALVSSSSSNSFSTNFFRLNENEPRPLMDETSSMGLARSAGPHTTMMCAAGQHCVNTQIMSPPQPPPPLTQLTASYLFEPAQKFEQQLDYYFSDFWLRTGDPRSSRLPFMSSGPWKLIWATLAYLYLIKWLLPKLMSRRRGPGFELNWCIRFYNLLMVLSNMYAFYHACRILDFGLKCFGCEVINHEDTSLEAMELLHFGWLFFMSRLVEWLDTIFFILRKKEKQATKLHIFHHSFVPIICWTYLKFHPGYTVAFFPLVNTFVHTIMYTYYLLATFGPQIQPYLWWKKYLTSLQITQFVIILIQLASIPLSSDEKCQYPRGFLYVAFAGAILFLWLFYTYYMDTYKPANTMKKPASSAVSKSKSPSSSSSASLMTALFQSSSSFKFEKNKQRSGIVTHKAAVACREGTSRALAEVIDNAIIGNDDEHLRFAKKLV